MSERSILETTFHNRPKEIEIASKELRLARKKITVFGQPLVTLKHFSVVIFRTVNSVFYYILNHNVFLFGVLPVIGIWQGMRRLSGNHTQYLDEVWKSLCLLVWWIGLGVLSSVGLGTGMHSGILFLFPHIYFMLQSAEECGHLDFDARTNMWDGHMEPGTLFPCGERGKHPEWYSEVSFSMLLARCLPYSLLWGLGTALGELPPYAASYAAAKAQMEDEDFEEFTADIAQGSSSMITKSKVFVLHIVQKWGFWGVLAMSAWPNAFFDLCGICCGHFMMPFWKFFLGLLVGKAFIKVFLQTSVLIFFFSQATRQNALQSVSSLLRYVGLVNSSQINSVAHWVDSKVAKMFATSNNVQDGTWKAALKSPGNYFGLIILAFMLYFLLSAAEQLAQHRQKDIDNIYLQKLKSELESRKKENESETVTKTINETVINETVVDETVKETEAGFENADGKEKERGGVVEGGGAGGESEKSSRKESESEVWAFEDENNIQKFK
eukprot:Platyproteum_vivax@DN4801_c0_g1_i1.p1